MDMPVAPDRSITVLLEMRPALDKHAGIPQQTRLLFRGLSLVEDLQLEGLLQSSTHALARGLPVSKSWFRTMPRHREVDRLSRVVIMLEQKFLRSRISAFLVGLRRLLGFSEVLTQFDPRQFRDFIWRRLFARTLPASDFDTVTNARFRIACAPWSAMHVCSLFFRRMGCALFPRLDTSEFDVMIAETPYPATVSPQTKLIIRYHDVIPLLMPHTISDRRYHQAFHYGALRRNVENGAWFVCVSEATRKDLLSIFPQLESRSVTIHNIVSHDYFDEPSLIDRVSEIVRSRQNSEVGRPVKSPFRTGLREATESEGSINYILMVATIEPRKNHLALISAWERLRSERFPGLRLILVGQLGWDRDPILRKLIPWVRRGEAFLLEEVPSAELRVLFKHARATVCPSFAEGFDLSGVEAMKSGGAVVASDIPVHREVYDDAAAYFNPYSTSDLVRALTEVVDPAEERRRSELIERGAAVAKRYEFDVIMPQWRAFLAGLIDAQVAADRHSRHAEFES